MKEFRDTLKEILFIIVIFLLLLLPILLSPSYERYIMCGIVSDVGEQQQCRSLINETNQY